jgi:chromosome segregation ATPase
MIVVAIVLVILVAVQMPASRQSATPDGQPSQPDPARPPAVGQGTIPSSPSAVPALEQAPGQPEVPSPSLGEQRLALEQAIRSKQAELSRYASALPDVRERGKERAELLERQQALAKERRELMQSEPGTDDQRLKEVEKELAELAMQVSEIAAEIATTREKLADSDPGVDALEAELQQLRAQLKELDESADAPGPD